MVYTLQGVIYFVRRYAGAEVDKFGDAHQMAFF